MSSIAVTCGLIILVLLVIMLLAGVPIAVALAVSSIAAILPVLNTGAAVLTGAQRIFSGISVFSLLYSCRKPDEQGRYRDPSDQLCQAVYRKDPWSFSTYKRSSKHVVWRDLRFWYSSSFRYGFYYRTY